MEDITIESLELFVRMNPKVDVLVLGSGDRIEFVPPPIREYLRQAGVTIEVQDTRRACKQSTPAPLCLLASVSRFHLPFF